MVSARGGFRWVDLLWLGLYPAYQVIGTFRHEVSHAVVAILQGAGITHFEVLPSFGTTGFEHWGYVSWNGQTTWLAIAAPYFCDLLTFILGFLACWLIAFPRRWMWMNLLVIGLLSPLLNSLYNYAGGILHRTNDVSYLLAHLPPLAVHGYFIVCFILYIAGLVVIFNPRLYPQGESVAESPEGQ